MTTFPPKNSLFSIPLQTEFNILVVFTSKNINQGHEFDLAYEYDC